MEQGPLSSAILNTSASTPRCVAFRLQAPSSSGPMSETVWTDAFRRTRPKDRCRELRFRHADGLSRSASFG